jgi:hypothetical protein
VAAASTLQGSGDPAVIRSSILNSWKEIAKYLHRAVRTVQRWETDLALPVRRPRAKSGSAVIALPSDIDNWLRSRPVTGTDSPSIAQKSVLEDVELQPLSDLVQESHLLRATLRHSRRELREVVTRLARNVERYRAQLHSPS